MERIKIEMPGVFAQIRDRYLEQKKRDSKISSKRISEFTKLATFGENKIMKNKSNINIKQSKQIQFKASANISKLKCSSNILLNSSAIYEKLEYLRELSNRQSERLKELELRMDM